MPSLSELQNAFARALIESGDHALLLEHIIAPRTLSAAGALGIYRNNVLSNYRKALRDDYPAVAALVGDRFFDAASDAYARAHPSQSGDLNAFGAAFSAFLERWPPAAKLPYLTDVARLEWSMQVSFNGADAPALNLATLAELDPQTLPELCFALHPSAVLLHSRYPILAIWRTSTGADDRKVDLSAGEADLLIIRREGSVEIQPVAAAERCALQALGTGSTISAASEYAEAIDAGFDLAAFLQRHVLSGTIVSFYRAARPEAA
jgi:hypothetical protein